MPDSPQTPQEQLSSYFARSASSVHVYADRFEHKYARPALNTSNAFFIEHPIFSVFLFSFAVLSLLPIGLFIGFCAFAILTFTILAICFIISASVMTLLFSLFFLTLTLLVIFCFSLFLTGSLFLAYITYRLFMAVRTRGIEGVYVWGSETISYVWPLRVPTLPNRLTKSNIPRRPVPIPSSSSDDNSDRKADANESHDSQSSDGAVLVDEKDAGSNRHSRTPSAESGASSGVRLKREED